MPDGRLVDGFLLHVGRSDFSPLPLRHRYATGLGGRCQRNGGMHRSMVSFVASAGGTSPYHVDGVGSPRSFMVDLKQKGATRMIAMFYSYIIQMGQPLWWLAFSPADVNSPIFLEMVRLKEDVKSRLKAEYPDHAKRLRFVATNHVASSTPLLMRF